MLKYLRSLFRIGSEKEAQDASLTAKSVNQKGVDFITGWESFVPYIYDDAVWPPKKVKEFGATKGYPTIGIGILIKNANEFNMWASKQPISKEEAQEIFAKKLPIYTKPVLETGFDYNQNQLNAMVSFCYNVGGTRFRASGVSQALKRGDVDKAMEVLLQYRRSGGRIMKGLEKRRLAEKKLFLS